MIIDGIEYELMDVTRENAARFQGVLESIDYITEYSGYEKGTMSAVGDFDEALPAGWAADKNKRTGLVRIADDAAVAWVKYYEGAPAADTIFLGELFVDRDVHGHGIGKELLACLESDWKARGFKNVVLNVDVKNWKALRFWINNGYRHIDRYMGDPEYSANTYAMLRLSKEL